jgi:hypothetical protein
VNAPQRPYRAHSPRPEQTNPIGAPSLAAESRPRRSIRMSFAKVLQS